MNFLSMAQKVRKLVGMQGTGPVTVTATDYDSIFVTLVNDSWEDIQLSKKKWKWMRSTVQITTVVGSDSYPISTIFGPSFHRFGRWNTEQFYIYDGISNTPLRFIEYDVFVALHINNSTNSRVTSFTVEPSTNAIIINKPDKVYLIRASYYKAKQTLVSDSDIPELPLNYHNVIVYDAVARYALNVSLASAYQGYSQKFAELYDDLVREQNPREILKVRGIV